jgi:ribosome-binding factor A
LVADIIQSRLADPRIPVITSVTRVEVSDDLAVARIFVSVMAPEAQRKLCLAALRHATGLFRRALAPALHLRKLPVLEFRLDDSVRQGFETVTVIERAMRELGQLPTWEQEDDDAPEQPDEARPAQPARDDQMEDVDTSSDGA